MLQGISSTPQLRKKKFNGFTMYCADAMSRRVQDPGESKDECRKRIMRFCSASWRSASPQGDSLRREWQLKAIEHNRSQDAVVPLSSVSNGGQLIAHDGPQYIAPLLAYKGHGVLGMGDASFGLSVEHLSNKDDSMKGFVTNYSSKWRSRACGQDVSVDAVNAGVTSLSCLEMQDFCTLDIKDIDVYTRVLNHIIKYIAAYRRQHIVAGRNKGPNSNLQLPLLIMCKRHL